MTPKVDLVGHPFARIGRGARLGAAVRAFRQVGIEPRVIDVGHWAQPPFADEPGGDVQIFFVDADEAPVVLETLGSRRPARSFRIIQPTRESAPYPRHWVRVLEGFDEVWAVSTFVGDALSRVVKTPVFTCPTPIGASVDQALGRRYFGIPESSFAFLSACDLRAHPERHNPGGVLEAFRRTVEARPRQDVVLVLKVGGLTDKTEAYHEFRSLVDRTTAAAGARSVLVLPGDMTEAESTSLLWSADCFVSLHRARGFGRVLAESMLLEKPVIATAYSGNMDFMSPDTACLVPFTLAPAPDPTSANGGQDQWAEPDLGQAVGYMLRLLDDRRHGRELGARAGRYVRTNLSDRAVGLRYLDRLAGIAAMRSSAA